MQIRCPHCNGSGKSELPKRLGEGLAALKALKVANVSSFSAKVGIELTASHHLMRRLVQAGLAQRVEGISPARYQAVTRRLVE